MTLPVSQFFTGRQITTSKNNKPLITDIPTHSVVNPSRIGGFGSQRTDPRRFWKAFSVSPELISTISIPITDIVGDRPLWTAPDGSALDKETRIVAEKFWRDNRGKEAVKAHLYDAFFSGDGYLWKGSPSDKEVKEAVRKVVKTFQMFSNLNTKECKELQIKASQDEDLKKPKKIDYVASSTMKILHDEREIKGYEQNANGIQVLFSPEQIIHFRYMTINGMVNGFTPVEALWAEITLLSLVKGNMLSFLQNGGAPDKAFILPKEIANSKNHSYLIETLKKYKRIQNRHGNLVFTGEMTIEDLQGNPKDLEYKDLALYITSNIAFAYGIPVSRIPYLIGKSAEGGNGTTSESGYWNRISDFQDTLEDLLNGQLFEELGWHIRFPRKYKQDEVRETQTKNMWADTIVKYQGILGTQGKQLTEEKLLSLLRWTKEDIKDLENNNLGENKNMNQNMLSNSQLEKNDNQNTEAGVRRNVVNSKGTREALQNP